MKKQKLSVFLTLFVVAVVVAASAFAVVAYMLHRSNELQNQFVPANVECVVQETFEADRKTSVTVKNTSNIDAYVRLRVVTYWQDSKGNVVGRTSPVEKFGDGWDYDTEKWIYNAKEKTFYYKTPVAAGQSTGELLKLSDSFKGIRLEVVEETVNKITYTYHPVMEFIAEAIQSQPASPSPLDKWGATVDANGVITAIS